MKKKIFLADDHPIFRKGLNALLSNSGNYDVIGESGDGRDALERVEMLKPDIVILDISMPSMTGIEVARQLKKYHPEIKIIILSQYDDEDYVSQVLQYGINGYILKENASEDLTKAIEDVLNGNIYLSKKIQNKFFSSYSDHTKDKTQDILNSRQTLTNRELEILKLVAEGKTNAEISSKLFISDKTVKAHRANIMKKLNIHKISDLIKYAIKKGLIEK